MLNPRIPVHSFNLFNNVDWSEALLHGIKFTRESSVSQVEGLRFLYCSTRPLHIHKAHIVSALMENIQAHTSDEHTAHAPLCSTVTYDKDLMYETAH